jgi:hypothetical protein
MRADPQSQVPPPENPDTSAGYTIPVRPCIAQYTLPLQPADKGSPRQLRCVLARGHSGNHRNGGQHWSSPEEALQVDG